MGMCFFSPDGHLAVANANYQQFQDKLGHVDVVLSISQATSKCPRRYWKLGYSLAKSWRVDEAMHMFVGAGVRHTGGGCGN